MRQGERAPAPVFLEPDGTPTDDPNALVERGGTPMLWGAELNGFRGFALSLWTEALSLLGGRPFIDGADVPPEEKGPGEHHA